MSRVDPINDKAEVSRDDIVPAKPTGFDEVSVKIDLIGFDDPSHMLIVEAWAGTHRIAHMQAQGGPRDTVNIAGEKIANPDLLVFTTTSNREHKGAIRITTTVKGDSRAKIPLETVTR